MGALDIFANQNDVLQAGNALLKYGSSQYDRNSASNGILSHQVQEQRVDGSTAANYSVEEHQRRFRRSGTHRIQHGRRGVDIRAINFDAMNERMSCPIDCPTFNIPNLPNMNRRLW